MMRSFFDTNVLVYLFDAGAPEKQAKARQLLEREVTEGQAILSTQVLQEFYVAVTRKLAEPLDPRTAEQALFHLAQLPVSQVDTALVLNAALRSRKDRLSFWDSLIVETALNAGADRLYTEDLHHGQDLDGLLVVNPFLD
jgi:predicted nucleic acid-binding protein